MSEMVNHPKHYNNHPSGVEVIEIVRHMGFNIGNATKYLMRLFEKGQAAQDAKKAIWYLKDELGRITAKDNGHLIDISRYPLTTHMESVLKHEMNPYIATSLVFIFIASIYPHVAPAAIKMAIANAEAVAKDLKE